MRNLLNRHSTQEVGQTVSFLISFGPVQRASFRLLAVAFLFSISATWVVAQDSEPRRRREVTESNGLVYYNGRPYSGEVFERAENKVMVFNANYLNGRRNGRYFEAFPNGKVKFEAIYNNGRLTDGTHTEFEASGAKAWTKTVKGGVIIREDSFSSGKLTQTKEYRNDGTLIKEIPYTNGLKNGEVNVYDSSGRLTGKEVYKQDILEKRLVVELHANGKLKLLSEVNSENIRNGVTEEYFATGELAKKVRYKDGNEVEVLEENADPSTTVGAYLASGRKVYVCDRIKGTDTMIVAVSFEFANSWEAGQAQTSIMSRINSRMKEVTTADLRSLKNKPVTFELIFKNINLRTDYEQAHVAYGLQVPAGYKAVVSFECQMRSPKTNITKSYNLSDQTAKYADRNVAISNFGVAVREATDKLVYGYFKLSGELISIIESNKRGLPTRVEINLGSAHAMHNGVLFHVFEGSGQNRQKIGLLVLQDVLGQYSSRCKVKEGEENIKRLMDSKKTVYVEVERI